MASRLEGFTPVQYAWVVGWALVVGLISHFADDSPLQLTALKVVMVPVIALAAYALERQFDVDEAYRRWSGANIERILVTAFILAAGVTFLIARPESPMWELVGTFFWMFLVFAVIAAYGPLSSRRNREIKAIAKEKGGS